MFVSTQCLDGAALHPKDGLRPLVVGDTMNGTIRIGPKRPDTMLVTVGKRADRAVLPLNARPVPKMLPMLVHGIHGEVTKDPKEQRQLNQLRIRLQAVLGFHLIFDVE